MTSLLIFNFSSASFMAPVENIFGFIVTAPFSLTSAVVAGYPGNVGLGSTIFSEALVGEGTTILTFLRLPNGEYQLHSQSFFFGQTVDGVTVQAIPEPTAAILFGSALAVLLGGSSRSRSKLKRRGK